MAGEGSTRRLCAIDELPDGEGREGREFPLAGKRHETVFVIRLGDDVVGYRNRCPHVGSPLNWSPDRFLDEERRHIVCATHGAIFRIEDGYCIQGPCKGDELTPIVLEVRDGEVHLLDA